MDPKHITNSAPRSLFISLPQELRDQIYSYIFKLTPQDYPGTRNAQIRIYDDHVILRRVCPSPPPRWRGAAKLMRVNHQLYSEVSRFLYSTMNFDIIVSGDSKDPGPLRDRICSDYPLGKITACPPLRHIKHITLDLDAWSFEEMEQLKRRFARFLSAVSEPSRLDVKSINLWLDDRSLWGTSSPMPGRDEMMEMLNRLKPRLPIWVYEPKQNVSVEGPEDLRKANYLWRLNSVGQASWYQ